MDGTGKDKSERSVTIQPDLTTGTGERVEKKKSLKWIYSRDPLEGRQESFGHEGFWYMDRNITLWCELINWQMGRSKEYLSFEQLSLLVWSDWKCTYVNSIINRILFRRKIYNNPFIDENWYTRTSWMNLRVSSQWTRPFH